MQEILIKAGCYIAIIVLGFVLRRRGFFGPEAFGVLSKVVIKITLPAAIVASSAGKPIDASLLTISALGMGGAVLVILVLSNIITAGTGIILAQYIGAGKSLKEKQPLIIGALMVNSLLGILFSLLAVFGTDLLLDLMRVNPEHRAYCGEYMRIVGGFLWVQMLAMTFSTVIRTHG